MPGSTKADEDNNPAEESETAALITHLSEYIKTHGLKVKYGIVIDYLQYLITEEVKNKIQPLEIILSPQKKQ